MSLQFQKRVDSSLIPFLMHREMNSTSPRTFNRKQLHRNIADKKCKEIACTVHENDDETSLCKVLDFVVHNDHVYMHSFKKICIYDLHSGQKVDLLVDDCMIPKILGKVFEVFQNKLFYSVNFPGGYATRCLYLSNYKQQTLEVGDYLLHDIESEMMNDKLIIYYHRKHRIEIFETDGVSKNHLLMSDTEYKAQIESKKLLVSGDHIVCLSSSGIHLLKEGSATITNIHWEEPGLGVYSAIGQKDFLILSLCDDMGICSMLTIHLPTLQKKSAGMPLIFDRAFLFQNCIITQCTKKIIDKKGELFNRFPIWSTNIYSGVITELFEASNLCTLEALDEENGLLVVSTKDLLSESKSIYSCKFFNLNSSIFIGELIIGELESKTNPEIVFKENRLTVKFPDTILIFDYNIIDTSVFRII